MEIAFVVGVVADQRADGTIPTSGSTASKPGSLGLLGISVTFFFFGGRWFLARELTRRGRKAEAAATLEEIVSDKNRTWFGGAVIWQKSALDLVRIYLQQGRFGDAKPLQSELADMLRFADPDHPVLLELESMRLRTLASQGG